MNAKAWYGLGFSLMATVLLTVSACQKKPEEETSQDIVAAPAAPMGYARSEGVAQVTLTLPEAIKAHPELHTRLYNEGKSDLDDFMAAETREGEAASISTKFVVRRLALGICGDTEVGNALRPACSPGQKKRVTTGGS